MKISYEVRTEVNGLADELIGWYTVDAADKDRFTGVVFKDETGAAYPWGAVQIDDKVCMCIAVPTAEDHQQLCYDKNFTPIRKE